ncbi:Rieske 2Fe-2S domain-containing protein [Dasania sp. GY-MA-18]|uniref:Rieske 2Fe-2S domain-containing protein n=1 Tax=Dasania phycosphaerae TaxID=2950436 RepID=A0A9J6RM86_9GAMM|nr:MULTISPECIES: SRPBCC family protein [Dasania]MCR8923148.1 Rieske 2Fe-2S domain-containing protein [Dasania sp. GY-MA-18]MCZ0865580.1 Rieske 2Fe-2S domain-containing protein [Dasania phycosphaerae]MCZ0869305.1 Rieske 2Fe-2S domain-containing protein [Dasania phycosphaerae]
MKTSSAANKPLQQLLDEISENANKNIQKAHSLSPQAYTSQAFNQLELEKIFRTDWICIGRSCELPEAGDYLTSEIAEQPIYTIRNADNEIRSYSNVCLHRLMVLLEGKGKQTRPIVCPYHAWTYQTDGQLVRGPEMHCREGFDPSEHRLPEVRTELWEGWIYVTLNDDASAISDQLEPLREILAPYHMENYVQITQSDSTWDTNWKCLAENFMESYHLPRAHRGTIGPISPLADMEMTPGTEHFNYHLIRKKEGVAGIAHPDNTALTGQWRNTTVLASIYPSHLIAVAPDYFWYLSLQPKGVDKVQVRYGVSIAPEVLAEKTEEDKKDFIEKTISFFNSVNEEDKLVVEGIFRGAKGMLSGGGPLCRLEESNLEFYQYLARKLN